MRVTRNDNMIWIPDWYMSRIPEKRQNKSHRKKQSYMIRLIVNLAISRTSLKIGCLLESPLFTAWLTDGLGGLMWEELMVYCPPPEISQILDLNEIFVLFLHYTQLCFVFFFLRLLKKEGNVNLLFWDHNKECILQPLKDGYFGVESIFSFQSHSRT